MQAQGYVPLGYRTHRILYTLGYRTHRILYTLGYRTHRILYTQYWTSTVSPPWQLTS